MPLNAQQVKQIAKECGFELAGIAPAAPLEEAVWYREWLRRGMAGEMSYLAGRRAEMRRDPRSLLPTARSVLCVGKLYNTPEPDSSHFDGKGRGWISRYAWGSDYHQELGAGLRRVAGRLAAEGGGDLEWRICVDTAPLLERAYARRAGLGWIGKNTCLINQQQGSWFFLGELLLSVDLDPDGPPPDRCGSCTACIHACPTQAIVPGTRPSDPAWSVDSRRCISYFTIELRGAVPEEFRPPIGNHVFGCDICQDVCPWNGGAPVTREPAFAARFLAPPLDELASLSEEEYLGAFAGTAVTRARRHGLLRNVAVAMGNTGLAKFREPLERLAGSQDAMVAEHARWALERLS